MIASNQAAKKDPDYSRPGKEEEWVRRVREEDDRLAFRQIFQAYYKRLHGFAYSFVKQREEAEGIVQSVFLNIWARRAHWDPPGSVKHYLFAAVRNKALNSLRHRKVVKENEDEVIRIFRELKKGSGSEDNHELKKLRRDIQEGIDQLPPRCRQIFVLSRQSGLTYSEIADFLDISVNTVGTQMGRALKTLRHHLVDYLYLLSVSVGWSAVLFYL